MRVEQFTDVFSLRDEIGTCPFIEVHFVERRNTILCKIISNERRTEESHTKRNG